MSVGADAGFEILDHPADVRLRLTAPDVAALYGVAVRGLAAVLTDGAAPTGATDECALDLEGDDPADLLVLLCNECLFGWEVRGQLAIGLQVDQVSAQRLLGRLQLCRPAPALAAAMLEVKAATYSDLRFEVQGATRVAELTLDL